MSINTIVIITVIIAALIGIAAAAYIYIRDKSLEDIRADVYRLFLKAEHTYTETDSGKQKMKYVLRQARGLLPNRLQFFVTEAFLEMIIQAWFDAVKDLLDDGRINRSCTGATEREEEDE